MAFVQRMLLLVSVAALGAIAAPQRGNNEYLPPDKGYDYPKPSVPFPPSPPVNRPPQNNPPPYNPPQPTPPVYRPPQNNPPVYRPPQNNPPPTYGPPPPAPPPYKPPQNNPPPYNPPQPSPPVYRPPQNNPPVYRPPQNPPPTYGPPPPQDDNQDGSGTHEHGHGHGHDHVHEAGMPYDFNYAVKDDYYGTDFSQNEASDGDNVKGEYRVQLPDGRLQIVTYTADWKTGFHAVVTYQGEAKYPEQKPYVPQASNTNLNQADAGYNYQPASTPVKPANSYGAPNY